MSGLVTGEIPLTSVGAIRDFEQFYPTARASVGRALAITLRNVDLATDAVDEALVRAYQHWPKVSRYDNPQGWVYRVALNHATSRIRRLKRHATGAAADRDGVEAAFDTTDPSVAQALASLSVDHRAVVVCRLLLGWSESTTATALRIRPGTVKSRLHRALRTLETRLDHLRPEDS